ncbi:MAG TPA: arginine decarboxylase [Gammaproteobacteria bacterium]|nr:arginine decarboxylase [Gammaproteobacteria bacterium]
MTDWNIQNSMQTYNIARWGDGYFGINAAGHMTVLPDSEAGAGIDLYDAARLIRDEGLSWPVLVRFPQILQKRVEELCQAFDDASLGLGFSGAYTPVYPIKVNQNRHVVSELLNAADGRIGLEAGSKPEMLAVMALSRNGGTIICNGYKDREYIRLALSARRMGLRTFIVIEKPSELALIIEQSRQSGVQPLLGMRLKLASIASGKWQSSGGEKSKFGLATNQALQTIEQLRNAGMLDSLQLLHVHLGSQMSNIRDIQNGLAEAARYYAEMCRVGVPLSTVDVGGGLGVDYDGTRTRSECSVNYSIREYAGSVVHAFDQVCQLHGLPYPDIISESGRALTAHHAMLITNVTEVDAHDDRAPESSCQEAASAAELRSLFERLDANDPLQEVFHDAQFIYQDAQHIFTRGALTIEQRATVEQLYYAICFRIFNRLKPGVQGHHKIFEQLEDSLADKVFCNFSVFQSMPDVWAIGQIFPVVPLQWLDEKPDRRAVIHDLTCDSDGRIDYYVDRDGVESTVALHDCRQGQDYLLGMFLVGAYQETLGDIHNLFGDTAAVNVIQSEDGCLSLQHPFTGETVHELLSKVEYDPNEIRQSILGRARDCGLQGDELQQMLEELEASLESYSYLQDDHAKK